MHVSSRIATVLIALSTAGCAAQRRPPAPTPPRVARAEHAVYRFDFALTSAEGTSQPTAFTLNLEEWNKGEIRLGKNAALVPGGSARQDVGLRVVTEFRTVEENVLLDVETEVSRIDSPTVHKMSVKSKALLAPNRPTVVATVEDGSGRFQLMVTSTRLR